MDNKTGILLINLGTPDGGSPNAVRRYLKEFLSDGRVIEKGGPLWRLILNGIILPRRSKELSRAYSLFWNTEYDESPLKTTTRVQAANLAARFAAGPRILIDCAMR